jgi:hypothetical protein
LVAPQVGDITPETEDLGLERFPGAVVGRDGFRIRPGLCQGFIGCREARGQVGVFPLEPRVRTMFEQPTHADGGDADQRGGKWEARGTHGK